MSFYELLDKTIELLERHRRISYRALKLELGVDDEQLEALKEEIIYARRLATDEGDHVLVYRGMNQPETVPQPRSPLVHTPSHLVDKILQSRAALEGERKHVTVLFADIKGSTELIQSLDPEDARRILDPALELMMDAVHQFEGTVNQVLGDGIMALFGAPLAHEDHALRACYAALQMQASMFGYADRLHDTHGVSLEIRVGLNSGQVVVRTISNDLNMEYSAVGHVTHLAAKMEQSAEAGSIVLTPETLRLVEGLVEVESLGKVQIKGLGDDLEIFELRDAKPVRKLRASADSGLTRFVGREPEVATFRAVMEQAHHGHGQVVAIVGEAGVGKSRLVYELIQPAPSSGWKVVESSSVSYGKVKAYFPVIDLLRNYFGIEEDAAAHDVRIQVMEQLSLLDTSLEDKAPPILSLLEALPQDSPFLALESRERHLATMEALKQLFFSEGQKQPLLIVFEDLHCIDNGTQAFLDTLVDTLPTARLLLLVNYRPEYRHNWGHKTYYTQIRLSLLASDSTYALLDDLLGNAEGLTELKQMLLERSEGNPFFLEESVRHLASTHIIAGRKGAYHLTETSIRFELPSTVQTVLAARIDRLPPEEKELLQTAAVIGTNVPFPLLQAVSQLGDQDLYRHLRNLLAGEFLYESRLYPERAFTFRHALTNEVAYESLLQDRRRTLHANIVLALEGLAGDRIEEQVERLAPHALRGDLWDKAVSYCQKAGSRAMLRSGFREARTCFENALEALAKLPESTERLTQKIDLHLNMRNVLFLLGDLPQVAEHLHTAESIAETLGDQHRLARVLNFLNSHYGIAGDPERAVQAGHRALRLRTTQEDPSLNVVANYYLGAAYNKMGAYGRAIDALNKGMQGSQGDFEHERFGTAVVVSVICRSHLVQCLAAMGRFTEGLPHGNEAIRIAQEANHPASLIYANCSLGVLFLLKGDFDEAISALDRSLKMCHSSKVPVYVPFVASRLGAAYAESGRIAEGLPYLEQAVQTSASVGRVGFLSLSVMWLSEGYLLADRVEQATKTAHQAIDLAKTHKERGHEAWALKILGDIAMRQDAVGTGDAEVHYKNALTLSTELEMQPLQAHCHLGLSDVYRTRGTGAQAQAELTAARDLYRALGMNFWLARAEVRSGQIESDALQLR